MVTGANHHLVWGRPGGSGPAGWGCGGALGGRAWHSFSSRELGGGNQIVVGSWVWEVGRGGSGCRTLVLKVWQQSREEGSGPGCWVERKVLSFYIFGGEAVVYFSRMGETWVCLRKQPMKGRPSRLSEHLTTRPPRSRVRGGFSDCRLTPVPINSVPVY